MRGATGARPRSNPRPIARAAGAVDKVLERSCKLGAYLSAIAILAIMLLTVANVAARSLFTSSVPGEVEGSQTLLVIAVFLGLGLAHRLGLHVASSLVVDHVPRPLGRGLQLVGLFVGSLFLCWVLIATGAQAWRSVAGNEYQFGLVRIPVWPARIAIVVGIALWTLEVAREVVAVLLGRPLLADGASMSRAKSPETNIGEGGRP